MGGRPRPDAVGSGRLILVDTSAWVEFLRDTGNAVGTHVENVLEGDIVTCDPVRMEVLAGARDENHLNELRRLLARASWVPAEPTDYEEAASLYRTCRRRGETVRRMLDCLIAAIAIRAGVPVLHADSDFDVLARHTALRVEQPPGE
jgi:predicted nucleic acid-binding protein